MTAREKFMAAAARQREEAEPKPAKKRDRSKEPGLSKAEAIRTAERTFGGEWLPLRDLAKKASLNESGVERALAAGKFRAEKVGRYRMVSLESWTAFRAGVKASLSRRRNTANETRKRNAAAQRIREDLAVLGVDLPRILMAVADLVILSADMNTAMKLRNVIRNEMSKIGVYFQG